MPLDNPNRRKRSRSRSDEYYGKDDINYMDEDSELSSGDDALNLSDSDVPAQSESANTNSRKRGRPKSQSHHSKDEARNIYSPSASISSPLAQQSLLLNEYESDSDETGEQKIDKCGRLLGDREYKVPTFKLPTRGDMLFMFSKDPAALLGFRDSFVFLKKNTKLVKVQIDHVEKGFLVDANLLRSTFRTREISVVTARSVFKQFGHRIVRKGKIGRDDYYFTEEVEGGGEEEHSEEEAIVKEIIEKAPIITYVPPVETGRNDLSHKLTLQDTHSNELNWLYSAALSTRQFNTSIYTYRRSNPAHYDLLSNVYQIPESKQTLVDTELFPNGQENPLNRQNEANNDNQSHTEYLNSKSEVDVGFR